MAKVKSITTGKRKSKKVARPGVHSKCKNSKSKRSKNYNKSYKGQGRS
jgi:hypothetical protein